ncbi:class I SAM-dependent methyltransferase [Paenibacillus sp. OSY-SE]|uniref:class I SAM-dependent methyltransferase n=1 Tax=Paenibacillus sp. OSY-SE TaxID=1196323 RepID=UPI0002D6073E|nr:class I SAM-dependent methyltransferase [Paenibacillus sp. OSY-SE]
MVDIKQQVMQQFGQNAAKYVTSQGHAQGEDLEWLLQMAAMETKRDVLDIATGGGHVANALAPLAENVVAYDLTPAMLDHARRFIAGNGHGNVQFVQGDAERLPFSDCAFDMVTCRIAAHHFPDVLAFVQESWRVLRPGGSFLLIDNVSPENDAYDAFYNAVEKRRDPSHCRALKKTEWLRTLEEKGLAIEFMMTFAKRFRYDSWFDRMGRPQQEKDELEQTMLAAQGEIQHHFRIAVEEERVVSFEGESMLVKARKEVK